MSADLDRVLLRAHRANIARYRRILKSNLTRTEREFIERQLGEEIEALSKIAQKMAIGDL